MREMIGLWIIGTAISSGISFVMNDGDLKSKFIMTFGFSVFLGVLEIGVYLMN